LDYGVIDRAERGIFWLLYYAKAATSIEASQTKLNLPLELSLAKNAEGKYIVSVTENGKPAANADVYVDGPSGEVIFQGKSGANGTVEIPAPKGSIGIRA